LAEEINNSVLEPDTTGPRRFDLFLEYKSVTAAALRMRPFVVVDEMGLEELAVLMKDIAERFDEITEVGFSRARGLLLTVNNPLETEFNNLLAEWRRDTEFSSDGYEVLLHPAHLAIIAMGRPVLRFIFRDMATGRGDWLTALDAIFLRRRPFSGVDEQNARAMREAWLSWARGHDLL
jgi:hypothetical protein